MNISTTRSNSDRRQPESIQHKVMKSVSEYNRQLNQERKEDRRVCMDLQTYTVQYPVGLGRENKSLRRWVKRRRRISSLWRGGRRYPVALLPTQYQDWFLQYTAQELKYFPLNTVMHGPTIDDLDKLPPLLQVTNGNNSDSDLDGSDVLSDLDDDSTCSCGEEHCSPIVKNTNGNMPEVTSATPSATTNNVQLSANYDENSCPPKLFATNVSTLPDDIVQLNSNSLPSMTSINNGEQPISTPLPSMVSQVPNSTSSNSCKVCHREVGNEEMVLRCADCGVISHPKCLDISGELLSAIRQYRWQCMDCKSCNQCGHPHDEAKMMFCDKCDRGYHTYCVGLATIPEGHWVCALCAVCANCGAKQPSENSVAQWQHELIKIHSPDGQTLIRHQVFCETCYQLRKI